MPSKIPSKKPHVTEIGLEIEEKSPLMKRAQKLKPDRDYVETRFKFTHGVYGDLELDVLVDNDSLVGMAMKKILSIKSLRCYLFGGIMVVELSDHSKLRVKSIRRLRGKG